MKKEFESISALLQDRFFISSLENQIGEIKKNRLSRPTPRPGFVVVAVDDEIVTEEMPEPNGEFVLEVVVAVLEKLPEAQAARDQRSYLVGSEGCQR